MSSSFMTKASTYVNGLRNRLFQRCKRVGLQLTILFIGLILMVLIKIGYRRQRPKLLTANELRKDSMSKIRIKSTEYPDDLQVILCEHCYDESLLEYDPKVDITYTIGKCVCCEGLTSPEVAH